MTSLEAFRFPPREVPWITTAQMVEVDRLMIEEYRIELIQMMENAGRALAEVARQRFLDGNPKGKRVMVLAGSGGNGGGALVAARRLHGYGAEVRVALSRPKLGGVPGHQLDILERVGVPVAEPAGEHDLIVDGLVGYSLRGAPTGRVAELIDWANTQPTPVLALDVPSGIDASDGTAHKPWMRADATLTLALPKSGLRDAEVGELYLADISVPPELYLRIGVEVGAVFAESDVIRLR